MEIIRFIEFGLSPLALFLLGIYHFLLYRKIRLDPLNTAQGLSRQVRAWWVAGIMQGGKDILAIQTLRNWTMAATFLASTAILIGLGIFNLALTADKQGELSLLMSQLSNSHPVFWMSKLILLGVDFLLAFFNFALSVRYFNHVGFMINLPSDPMSSIDAGDVVEILNRGGAHYTLGMRGYYLAVPLALWLFGPLWLLAGTICLLAVLYRLDRGV
jgi:uncharacterized membrane protein